ncbi:MAG: UDP-N-acetylmuramoyl-L-alanyl-D-glutamate--2,6-diaminopimelate ligase, partial [Patescibacteria group bacterium]
MLKSIKAKVRKFLPNWLVDLYHLVLAVAAAVIYRFPSRRLRVIGVTGTNGKTTTCHLVTAILEAAGRRVGMTTTISYQINSLKVPHNLKMTTYSPFALQRLLRRMVNQDCQDAVLEVTSIGLDQHRLWGINFYGAVFTNLTHDHLDYNQTMDSYRKAKGKMFAQKPYLSVINADDPAADYFLGFGANRTLTYGINEPSDILAKKIYPKSGGTDFVLLYGGRQATVNLPLPGVFNVYNVLAAAAVGFGLGISPEVIIHTLNHAQAVPGRMELVEAGQSFVVIVDYAHSPDALQKVYETIKPTVRGRLISVLGAAGERDRAKRPILGALAGRYADLVIVTDEDPYSEDPQAIIDQVAAGVPRGRPRRGRYKINRQSQVPYKYKDTGENEWWWRILDRRGALERAVEMARPQDVLLVTGKGAEQV